MWELFLTQALFGVFSINTQTATEPLSNTHAGGAFRPFVYVRPNQSQCYGQKLDVQYADLAPHLHRKIQCAKDIYSTK